MSKDIYTVYKITNTINSKVYIGITSRTLARRWNAHKIAAKDKINRPLYDTINKYGMDQFTITPICSTFTREDLGKLEQQFIKEQNTIWPNGYNLTSGGEKSWTVSEEAREKMKGNTNGRGNKGRVLTKEWKEKISTAKMGHTYAKALNWIVTTPDGEQLNVFNLKQYCQKQSINYDRMRAVAFGLQRQHKGYKCSKVAE